MRVRLKVKEVALAKGFNMSSLSRRADISFRTVKRYFKNPYEVATTEVLGRLAEAMKVDVSELVELVDDDYEEKAAAGEETEED